VAVLTGAAGSVVVRTYRRDKKRAKQLLSYTAIAGLAGMTIGYAVGYVKRSNTYMQALSLGTNLFIVSGTFLVIRESCMARNSIKGTDTISPGNDALRLPVQLTAHLGTSPMYASAIGGAATGFLITLFPWRGFFVAVLNSLQGLGLGVAGQHGYDKARLWRLEKAIEYRYPDLFVQNDNQPSKKTQKQLDWQTWLTEILTRKSYSGRLDEKIRSLEVQMEILEEEEIALLQQLEKQNTKQRC